LFNQVTRVPTKYCFQYNNAVYFCVPRNLLSKALGEDARNIHKISDILRKRVRIVPIPMSLKDARGFISAVVNPVTFKDLEIHDDEMILTAGSQSKAALIGRNKRRLLEMQEIVKDFFKKDFKIV